MASESSVFDPDVTVDIPKVEQLKIEQPKIEQLKIEQPKIEKSDKSIIDSITDFFENLSFENNPEIILMGVIGICLVGYLGYDIYKKEEALENSKKEDKQNIDFNDIDMFYINSDKNTKKGIEFETNCKKQNLDVVRYTNIDGEDIPNELIDQILGTPNSADFKKSVLENNRENIDFLGSFLSHIGVYQEFMESNKPYCIIFEDNVTFNSPSFKKSLNKHIENIPKDWDMIILGNKISNNNTIKNNIIYDINELENNNCYMINKNSCKKLLENLVNPRWYLDWSIGDLAKNGFIKIYGITDSLVI